MLLLSLYYSIITPPPSRSAPRARPPSPCFPARSQIGGWAEGYHGCNGFIIRIRADDANMRIMTERRGWVVRRDGERTMGETRREMESRRDRNVPQSMWWIHTVKRLYNNNIIIFCTYGCVHNIRYAFYSVIIVYHRRRRRVNAIKNSVGPK